ncbi:MAG TPA: MMPL family transporter, partial [Streptosporangiaceae bacterium]|nr:MMPL family transporter [Streptosporangiaceae bacterium]
LAWAAKVDSDQSRGEQSLFGAVRLLVWTGDVQAAQEYTDAVNARPPGPQRQYIQAILAVPQGWLEHAAAELRSLAGTLVPAAGARFRARRAGLSAREQAAQTSAATHDRHEHSAFARWGKKVSDRPWPWAIVSVLILVMLSIPLFSITLGQPDNGTNPTSESNRQAYDLISEGFGVGVNGPLVVVVKLPKESSQDTQQLLSTMQQNVKSASGVASVGPAQVNSAGTTALFSVVPTTRPQATQTEQLVHRLRDTVLPKSHETTYVTGTTAGTVDFSERITSRIPWLILTVVAIAFVLLTVAFRSVVIAVKAAVFNLLSIGAAYGVIVAIFHWGWGASLIGLHTTLPVPAYVPMLVFAIVFGLSMDYEVFLLSRVHEAWVATRDPHRSVAIGIGSTARVITTAAAIMVVVFASFVLDTDPTVKMLSIGMAFAVLIDASLVRMMLVPSVMSLLGKHAWWMPRWLEPIVPHLQLEGSTEPAPDPEPVAEPEPEPVAVEEVAVDEVPVAEAPSEPVAEAPSEPVTGTEAKVTSEAEVTPGARVMVTPEADTEPPQETVPEAGPGVSSPPASPAR